MYNKKYVPKSIERFWYVFFVLIFFGQTILLLNQGAGKIIAYPII